MSTDFIGIVGAFFLLFVAFLFSTNKRAINLRVVLSAFALQIVIAAFVLFTPVGVRVVEGLSTGVSVLLGYSTDGIELLFGPLADEKSIGTIFAVQLLPIVIFFASLMSILYHFRIMPYVVAAIGSFLRLVIGTRPVESLNAAANIFVGQTEAPLAIKPYLDKVTGPQLFTIMVSGLASVAGTVLAAYAGIGIKLEYLLAASIMAAPGGLLMAKIIMPDGPDADENALPVSAILKEKSPHTNVFMAAAMGATDGLKLALNIGAMLIAFVSLIALANGIIGGLAGLAGIEELTLQKMLGWVFSPVMFLLGVPWVDAQVAGGLFGEKLVLNEFVAYFHLIEIRDTLQPRSVAIITFALCGFANLLSIGILLGGLGALVPDRMSEIARYGMHALLAASLSNLMSATLAGLLLRL
ncbi:MAG: nucleoside transporter C-terminal domain-containing protein [Pseudomonadota bacterium]